MKKLKGLPFIVAIGVLIVILIGVSYYKNKSNDNFNGLHIGYISIESEDLNDTTFLLDEIEWITHLDKERMHELSLTSEDMPNGYYIYDVDGVETPITVNEETVYQFYDWNQVYVKDENDREYTTTDKSEFMKHISSYRGQDKRVQPPFWVEIKDGIVVKIKEQLIL